MRAERRPAVRPAPIEHAPRAGPAAALVLPGGLWFLDQLAPGQPTFNVTVAGARSRGPLDRRVLERGFDEMVRRHEIAPHDLRRRSTARPVQVVRRDDRTCRSTTIDLRSLDRPDRRGARPGGWRSRRPASRSISPGARSSGSSPGPAGRRRPRAPADDAPHHQRRLVVRRRRPRAGGALRRLQPRRARRRCPSPADPVRRLRAWQQRLLEGEALERLVGYWTRQLAGVAPLELPDRPAAPADPDQPRRLPSRSRSRPSWPMRLRALCRRDGVTPVHDPAGGLAGPAPPLQRPGRLRRRLADRQPQPVRGRGADRLLREHAGPADRPLGRPDLPRPARAGCARSPSWPSSTRTSRSRRSIEALRPPPRPEPHAALPGDVRPPEQPVPDARPTGLTLDALRPRRGDRDGQVRPDAGDRRGGPRSSSAAIEYNTDLFDPETIVRMSAALPDPARRHPRRPGPPPLLAPLIDRRGAASDPRQEWIRTPERSGARRVHPPALRGPGRADAGRDRRRVRGPIADLSRSSTSVRISWPASCGPGASARTSSSASA